MGPGSATDDIQEQPTAIVNLTWVKNNHTYKFGGEWRIDTFTNISTGGVAGIYNFSNVDTGLPSTNGQNLQGGSVGFNYASFLLGLVNNASLSNTQAPQYRRTN